jgi:hypothetical protein
LFASGRSFTTRGEAITAPSAESINSTRPIRNRLRVSATCACHKLDRFGMSTFRVDLDRGAPSIQFPWAGRCNADVVAEVVLVWVANTSEGGRD